MVTVAGLVLALACLFLWLTGHWFGRVVAFLAFTAAGCVVVGLAPAFAGYQEFGYLAAAGLAWLVAGVPALLRRRREAVAVRVESPASFPLQLVVPHGARNTLHDH